MSACVYWFQSALQEGKNWMIWLQLAVQRESKSPMGEKSSLSKGAPGREIAHWNRLPLAS